MTYWDRLKVLNIYSLQRRRERLFIFYVFKIIVGADQNIPSSKFEIKTYTNVRRGRFCVMPPLIPGYNAKMRRKIEASFPVMGPRLFNSLPSEIRDFEGNVISFKRKLDKFLAKAPDKPVIRGYTQTTASNSILDRLFLLRA